MFDRYQGGDNAVLVHVSFNNQKTCDDLAEFKMLVTGAGVNVLSLVTAVRQAPDAKFFVGSGKAEEIAAEVAQQQADLVIVNHPLSPSQERNLEKVLCARVIDRTGLILDIFAQRARSHEGKLQVELAQLRHLSTRLVRGWTHLERQKGGIGLRGPGETQLETDRRLIRGRIKALLARIEKVSKQREQGRRMRQKNSIPTVAFVGYTNAGKSTLFNSLTAADVYAADQLFATLDPTLRRIQLEDVGEIVLADTVGFIRNLPHDLIAAFKATLQEIVDADLVLHIIDATDPQMQDNIEQVEVVLAEIGAADRPKLCVLNKIDNAEHLSVQKTSDEHGQVNNVWVSAKTGEGLNQLKCALTERLAGSLIEKTLTLPANAAKLRGIFYQLNGVKSETFSEHGEFVLNICLPALEWHRLTKQEEFSKFL